MDDTTGRVTGSPGSGAAAAPADNALPAGTRLHEFEIRSVIGEGGFSLVYVAFDHTLHRTVALKEYIPRALAGRNQDNTVVVHSARLRPTFEAGMRSFINEARLLAQFDHPALVKVYRFWEGNATAYMAMPLYEGRTLKQVLKSDPAQVTQAWLKKVLAPVLDALALLHAQRCYHRDISPDNIQLLANDAPVLLDFGAARRTIEDRTQAFTAILKPSYAPLEQYAEDAQMKQGPWTDVYALAAVMYTAITQKPPPASVARVYQDPMQPLASRDRPGFDADFLRAIDRALAVRPEDRVPTMHAFAAALGMPPPRSAPPPDALFTALRRAQDDDTLAAPNVARPTDPDATLLADATGAGLDVPSHVRDDAADGTGEAGEDAGAAEPAAAPRSVPLASPRPALDDDARDARVVAQGEPAAPRQDTGVITPVDAVASPPVDIVATPPVDVVATPPVDVVATPPVDVVDRDATIVARLSADRDATVRSSAVDAPTVRWHPADDARATLADETTIAPQRDAAPTRATRRRSRVLPITLGVLATVAALGYAGWRTGGHDDAPSSASDVAIKSAEPAPASADARRQGATGAAANPPVASAPSPAERPTASGSSAQAPAASSATPPTSTTASTPAPATSSSATPSIVAPAMPASPPAAPAAAESTDVTPSAPPAPAVDAPVAPRAATPATTFPPSRSRDAAEPRVLRERATPAASERTSRDTSRGVGGAPPIAVPNSSPSDTSSSRREEKCRTLRMRAELGETLTGSDRSTLEKECI